MRRLSLFLALCGSLLLASCGDDNTRVDSAAQMKEDIAIIDKYLADNKITAIKDQSGIRFQIIQLGTGGFPAKTDQQVKVEYKGELMSGFVFDAGGLATSQVSGLIPGWQLAMTLVPKGSKIKLWIPSPLGYSDQEVGLIPANSILVFTINLLDVIPSNAEKQRLAADIATIDKYLTDNAVANVVKDTTGVRYVITDPGTDPKPTWYTGVRFDYTGKLLSTGNQFYSGTSQPTEEFDSRVVDFIHGIKVGLTKVGTGGKIRVYVPSSLAFGTADNPSANVPANSNVFYDIELKQLY